MRSKTWLSLLLVPSILTPSLGSAMPSIRVRMTGLKVAVTTENSTASESTSFNPWITDEQINNCLVSMCGTPEQSGSGAVLYDKRLDQAKRSQGKTWNREFAPEVERVIREQQQADVKTTGLLVKTLERKDAVLRENSPLKNFVAFIQLMKLYPKDSNELFTYANGTFELNPATFEKIVKNVDVNDAKAFELMLRKVFIPMFLLKVTYPNDSELMSRFKFLYPGLKPSEALVADSAIILRKVEALSKMLGEIMMSLILDDTTRPILQKASQGQDLNSRETELYTKFASSLDMFGPIFLDNEVSAAFQKTSLRMNDILEQYKASGDAQKRYSKAVSRLNDDTPRRISAICRENMNASLILNTSDFRLKRLQSYLPEIKMAAKEVVAKYAGPNSKISDAIEKTIFSIPQGNRERLESIRKAIESVKTANRNSDRILTTQNTKEQTELVLLIAVMAATIPEEKDPALESDITKACQALPQDYLSDYALSALGKISLSWYTAAYPDLGVGVVAHELGHVVDANFRSEMASQIRNDGFKESMSCVVNRNPFVKNVNEPENRADNIAISSKYAAEDWADHFATQVVELLKAKGFAPVQGGRNWACSLIKGTRAMYAWNSLAAPGEDPHSTGFMRALMNNFDRGQVTQECRPVMQPIEDLQRQMKCQ